MTPEEMVFAVPTLAILATMGLALARALKGPSVFDRMLAVNMFGTKTVLLIAVFGFLTGRPDFLDLALVYAIMNFIGVIAVLKYFLVYDMAHGHEQDADPAPSAGGEA